MGTDEPLRGWADEAERFSENHPARMDTGTPPGVANRERKDWRSAGFPLQSWERVQGRRSRWAVFRPGPVTRMTASVADLTAAIAMILAPPPPPKRGGTFFYCPWREQSEPGTVSVCGIPHARYRGARFRTQAAYRRHWRRYHT